MRSLQDSSFAVPEQDSVFLIKKPVCQEGEERKREVGKYIAQRLTCEYRTKTHISHGQETEKVNIYYEFIRRIFAQTDGRLLVVGKIWYCKYFDFPFEDSRGRTSTERMFEQFRGSNGENG